MNNNNNSHLPGSTPSTQNGQKTIISATPHHDDKNKRKKRRSNSKMSVGWIVLITLGLSIVGLVVTLLILLFRVRKVAFPSQSTLLPNNKTPLFQPSSSSSHSSQLSPSTSSSQSSQTSHTSNSSQSSPTTFIANQTILELKTGDMFMTRHVQSKYRDERMKKDDSHSLKHALPCMSNILQAITGNSQEWTHVGMIYINEQQKIMMVDITRKGVALTPMDKYVDNLGLYEELAIWPLNQPLHQPSNITAALQILLVIKPKYDLVGVVKRMICRSTIDTLSSNYTSSMSSKKSTSPSSITLDKTWTANISKQALDLLKQSHQTCTSLLMTLWCAADIIELKEVASKDTKTPMIHNQNYRCMFAHETLSNALIWKYDYGLLSCGWIKKCSHGSS